MVWWRRFYRRLRGTSRKHQSDTRNQGDSGSTRPEIPSGRRPSGPSGIVRQPYDVFDGDDGHRRTGVGRRTRPQGARVPDGAAMMNFEVERFGMGLDSTLSRVWNITDGNRIPLCWGLEDERRETKVFAETCIPVGTYEMALRQYGKFHDKYSGRYPDIHKGTIELIDVKGFSDILWHIGNDDEDTGGCLLLGSIPIIVTDGAGEFTVGRSADAYKKVYPQIANPLSEGERCLVTYLERQAYG